MDVDLFLGGGGVGRHDGGNALAFDKHSVLQLSSDGLKVGVLGRVGDPDPYLFS